MSKQNPADSVPPTEPQSNPASGTPATPEVARAVSASLGLGRTIKPIDVKTQIDGASLVPDRAIMDAQVKAARRHHYWVGMMPNSPLENVSLAGNSWPKVNQTITDSPMRDGERVRNDVIGTLVTMDESQVLALQEALPRKVIRFRAKGGESEEAGTGQNIGDLVRQPRKGELVTIPRPADQKAKKAMGLPIYNYEPDPADQPAARYLFCILCPDQTRPERGQYYPDSLEVTGIQWPDEIIKD